MPRLSLVLNTQMMMTMMNMYFEDMIKARKDKGKYNFTIGRMLEILCLKLFTLIYM
jgi:hypothetical protein